MRRSSFAFALLATATAAAVSPVFAADTVAKSIWDGYGEGSWVASKSTTKTEAGGQPANEFVAESRTTLKKVTDKAYTIKQETKMGEEWMPFEYDVPRIADPKAEKELDVKSEDLGTEKLTVDGESIECMKTKTVIAGTTTIAWTNEKYGTVKSESKGAAGDSALELTKLKATQKVKGKDVACLVRVSTMKSPAMEMSVTSWTSDTIPQGLVRSETTTKMTGMTTTVVVEVTDFEKK